MLTKPLPIALTFFLNLTGESFLLQHHLATHLSQYENHNYKKYKRIKIYKYRMDLHEPILFQFVFKLSSGIREEYNRK